MDVYIWHLANEWTCIAFILSIENNVINARLKVDSREKLMHIYGVHGAVRELNLHVSFHISNKWLQILLKGSQRVIIQLCGSAEHQGCRYTSFYL